MGSSQLPTTAEMRGLVDDALNRFLDSKQEEMGGRDERRLLEEVRRIVSAGGKRLRPLFCYWGYRAAGGADVEAIIRTSASLELLHTFAIVHDDVMDASPLRRGQATVHRRLAGVSPDPSAAERFGASAAVLAGDLAFVLADELFYGSGFEWPAISRGAAWFTAMRREVIAGQFLDLEAAARGHATPSETRRIASLKSGGYTVEKPLLIGASLGGAGAELLERLGEYGRPLGEAFQIRDDVLGLFGDPLETGKDAHGDILEGKQTFLIAVARERARAEDRALLDDRLGRGDLSAEDIDRVRDVVVRTGARDEADGVIERLTNEAVAVARAFPAEVAEALVDLARAAAVRRA